MTPIDAKTLEELELLYGHFEHIPDLIQAARERDELKRKLDDCKHPGCCCVCGHNGTCPECGPSLIDDSITN